MQKKELSKIAKEIIENCLILRHTDLQYKLKGNLKHIDLATLDLITNESRNIEITLKEMKELL